MNNPDLSMIFPKADPSQGPAIIYHGNCPDGFASAWWLGRNLGAHEKYPASYNTPAPDLVGRMIYMVDFCYKADELQRLINNGNLLVILDHHMTQIDEIKELELPLFNTVDKLYEYWIDQEFHNAFPAAVMDMEHSGIGLVMQFVSRGWPHGDDAPEFLYNIEDRDLWRFDLPHTKTVTAAVTSRSYQEEAWEEMARLPYLDLAREGEAIERYRRKTILGICETAYLRPILGHEVWCVCCPYEFGSEVAHELCLREPERPFAAYYVDYGDRHKFGLRSLPDGMDVGSLAKQVEKGGGHTHASGFDIYLDNNKEQS